MGTPLEDAEEEVIKLHCNKCGRSTYHLLLKRKRDEGREAWGPYVSFLRGLPGTSQIGVTNCLRTLRSCCQRSTGLSIQKTQPCL